MLTMPNFTVAQTFDDFPLLEPLLNQGGIVVVELNNKYFMTRILDGGKRLRITEHVVFGQSRVHEIKVGKGPRFIDRVKTQITGRNGAVHKFEAYYLAYKLAPGDLRDELVAALPNV